MSRIKIIERDEQIEEKVLTRYERQGLVLISVNRGNKKFRAPNDFTMVLPWVYHFRIEGSTGEGTDRLPVNVSHGSGETSL